MSARFKKLMTKEVGRLKKIYTHDLFKRKTSCRREKRYLKNFMYNFCYKFYEEYSASVIYTYSIFSSFSMDIT